MNKISFSYNFVDKLKLDADGHYYLQLPAFYSFESHSNAPVDFIFDTGAYLTVLSRNSARDLELMDKFTTQKGVKLSGFAGGCLADIKEIPGLIIGGRRMVGVKVAVPHIDTPANILGLNVIDHFKFLVDTDEDKIYFADNPNPGIPDILRARRIYAVDDEKNISQKNIS